MDDGPRSASNPRGWHSDNTIWAPITARAGYLQRFRVGLRIPRFGHPDRIRVGEQPTNRDSEWTEQNADLAEASVIEVRPRPDSQRIRELLRGSERG
jgi:hypothetical protein